MDAAHHLLFSLCLIKCDHYCLHCEELDETAVQNASLHGSYCCVLYLVAS